MIPWKPLLLVLAALASAGCSGIPRRERDQEQLERYLRYAKPPVDRINLLGRDDNWQSVSKYQLVFWANINDAYLITVSAPCENLQFAQRIGITRTVNSISAKFDAVVVRGWRCQIAEIRPIDYLQMRRDQRAEREQKKAAEDPR
jgi:hypothetical protein